MDPKLQYRSKNEKIEDLIESIKSRIYDFDFEGEKINWGHVGTMDHIINQLMDHIINQLNDIDNSLAGYGTEPNIEDKVFNCKTRRFDNN